MPVSFSIDATHATARLDRIGPATREALVSLLGPLAQSIAGDARSRAEGHFHSLGLKPGRYLASIYGGVAAKDTRVTAYVRSGSPLAHLLEYGFTITDLMIQAKAGEVMAFEGDAGTVFRRLVHRHETQVRPYPAIHPAFDDARAAIKDAMAQAIARGAEN